MTYRNCVSRLVLCLLIVSSIPSLSASTFVYTADGISSQISGFSVAADGTLTPVPGSPYTLPAEFPVTVTPTSLAYIAPYLIVGAANPDTFTGISVFKVDKATGALTQIPNGPPMTTFIDYQLIVASPQTRTVYAIGENNSATQQSGISTFRLTTAGVLKQIGPTIYPGTPAEGALALDPLGRFLYVYDLRGTGGLHVFNRNANGTLGSEAAGSPFKVGKSMTFTGPDDPNACLFQSVDRTLVAHPNGKYLYISCTAGRQVTELNVAGSGTVTVKRSIPLAASDQVLSSLAIDGSGEFLFGTEENQNNILVFSLNPTSGAPKLVNTATAGTRPNSVAPDPAAAHLFVTNGSSNVYKGNNVPGSNNLSFYSLNADGSLTPVSGSPIATGTAPRSVIVVTR